MRVEAVPEEDFGSSLRQRCPDLTFDGEGETEVVVWNRHAESKAPEALEERPTLILCQDEDELKSLRSSLAQATLRWNRGSLELHKDLSGLLRSKEVADERWLEEVVDAVCFGNEELRQKFFTQLSLDEQELLDGLAGAFWRKSLLPVVLAPEKDLAPLTGCLEFLCSKKSSDL